MNQESILEEMGLLQVFRMTSDYRWLARLILRTGTRPRVLSMYGISRDHAINRLFLDIKDRLWEQYEERHGCTSNRKKTGYSKRHG